MGIDTTALNISPVLIVRMMTDYWHEVEFIVGLRAVTRTNGTIERVDFQDAWVRGPNSAVLAPETRLVRVKLEVPESHWKLPAVRGKLKSDLSEEYSAFLEEMV